MARTISEIQQALLNQVAADSTLSSQLTSTSNVAIWRLWTYVVAFCQWTLEVLFDQHVAEINNIVATQKAHTLQWYVAMAKKFQYGDNLVQDADYYDPVNTTNQIITYAAATELNNGLRIKVAKTVGSDLAPLITAEKTAFTAYMNLVKDAGVRLNITSGSPDSLKLTLNIYYNALVLDNMGQRLDGTANTPVQDAIGDYLKTLPFNGLYTNFALLNAIAAVDGVVIPDLVSAQANYGSTLYVNIDPEYKPDSGYLRIINPTDLVLYFFAHTPIN
jgi:hypothetical protein